MISQVQISYILALLKYNNFQRAAESCHVTQPTLSMQIKKAEETIGYQIINRDTNPISLTEEGEKLYPNLLDIQESFESLEINVLKLRGIYKAEIRLGIIPTISSYLVPELYAQWKKELGHLHLDIKELTSEILIESLRSKEIDFGIMAGPLEDPSINQQILYNEEILIYAPTIKGKTIHLEQLEDMNPWLLSPGNCLRTQMINFCKLNKLPNKEWNYEGGNLQLVIKMVEQEGGYTLIPAYYLPYLELNPDHIKKIQGVTPIRQIIGLHLTKNTKREAIIKIMRTIQRSKNDHTNSINNPELLPWKA